MQTSSEQIDRQLKSDGKLSLKILKAMTFKGKDDEAAQPIASGSILTFENNSDGRSNLAKVLSSASGHYEILEKAVAQKIVKFKGKRAGKPAANANKDNADAATSKAAAKPGAEE